MIICMQKYTIININSQHNAYIKMNIISKNWGNAKSIRSKFWSIIDSSLHTYVHTHTHTQQAHLYACTRLENVCANGNDHDWLEVQPLLNIGYL